MVYISFYSINCTTMQYYPQRFQNNIDCNYGGKIVLPHRCLNEIATKSQGEFPNPMLFKLINKSNQKFTHCGVIDFSNYSPNAFVPDWVLNQIEAQEPVDLKIELVYLPIATYTRLKPLTPDFKNIAEPIVVLEICLRQYCCLSVNDIISILYNKKVYNFKVESLKPSPAVNIIECDMNVEFSSEEELLQKSAQEEDNYKLNLKSIDTSKFTSFAGKGQRLDGKERKLMASDDDINIPSDFKYPSRFNIAL